MASAPDGPRSVTYSGPSASRARPSAQGKHSFVITTATGSTGIPKTTSDYRARLNVRAQLPPIGLDV